MDKHFEFIKTFLVDNCDVSVDKINLDATIKELGIDSLNVVELICAMEDEYNFDLTDLDNIDDISTINDLILKIKEREDA